MSEKMDSILCELISAAGAARSSYISAIQAVKSGEGDPEEKIKEGDNYFEQAHTFHREMLELDSGGDLKVTMFMVHVEDQLMCAETFRILSQEFIDLYNKLK